MTEEEKKVMWGTLTLATADKPGTSVDDTALFQICGK